MVTHLRDLARSFADGAGSPESLSAAAQTDQQDPALAQRIQMLLTEWENSDWTVSDLRARVGALV